MNINTQSLARLEVELLNLQSILKARGEQHKIKPLSSFEVTQ